MHTPLPPTNLTNVPSRLFIPPPHPLTIHPLITLTIYPLTPHTTLLSTPLLPSLQKNRNRNRRTGTGAGEQEQEQPNLTVSALAPLTISILVTSAVTALFPDENLTRAASLHQFWLACSSICIPLLSLFSSVLQIRAKNVTDFWF